MKTFIATIIFSLCYHGQSQIVFPDSILLQKSMVTPNDRISQLRIPTQDAIVSNIHNIRETAEYDKRVEEIVTNGISNLAVAINNFYLNRRGFDNVVLSPVSIAGKYQLASL